VDPLPAHRAQISTGSLSGERRQATALFYDIVGSTELLSRLDPEDFGTMQRMLHSEATAAIQAYGGHIDRIQGDGGCAYFGLPVALEDAAERAVGCALEMVERCVGIEQKLGSPLRVRVGVATGLVVVADTRGTRLPGQDEVIGLAPALAARIQSEAEPNSVAVAESTYRLTRGAFEYEQIGARSLKGLPDPVQLWRPLAPRPHVDRFSARRRAARPLVGREDELEMCRRRWARARRGSGQFVFLQGEPGIGKSRLVAELRQEVAGDECEVVVFQCQPRGNAQPLHPFLDRLREGIAASESARPVASGEAIRAYFRSRGSDIGDVNAEIISFLSESGDGPTDQLWAIDLSTEEIGARAVDAMLAVLASWSRRAALLVIEDVHWADSLSASVLARLPARIEALPILVVATSRDTIEVDLLGEPNVGLIALSRLDAAAVSRLLDSSWEGRPPERLAAFIYEKSDGIPLFAEELAYLLEARFKTGGSDPKDWEKLLREGHILTLQDLIAARLSGLGPLRRVAQIASVVGREFGLEILAPIMRPEDLPLPLEEAMKGLVQAGILGRGAAKRESSYRFRHVLIQEAAYDSLLKSDRRELHQRIVELVRSGSVSAPTDEMMAWHCQQAGQLLQAARYGVQAAEAYVARSAVHEADRLLASAREQLRLCGGGAQTDDLLLQLLATQGPVAAALYGRGSPQACAIYEEGVALCRERDDKGRARWLPLYWGWWFTAPSYEVEKARAEIVVRDLEKTTDPEVRLQSLHCAWASNFEAGKHAYCLDCIAEGLALYDEERARWSRSKYGGHDAKVCGLGERALSHWFTGDDAGSARSIDEAMRWAERTAHVDSIFHALEYAVGLARYRGDCERVRTLSARMARIANEHAMPGGRAKARLFAGWAQALAGEPSEGLAQFEEGFALQLAIGTEENLPIYRDMKAQILTLCERDHEALNVLDEAIESSTRNGQVLWLAELYRRRALVRLKRQCNARESLSDLERAAALAEEQGASVLAARARADIERLRSSAPRRRP
jgi:class 3 adenylate cyclase/predicted ATPase